MYILQSKKDNNLYIGFTVNLRKRYIEHKQGNVYSTRNRQPLDLVYYESYKTEKEARHRESNLKLRANAYNQLKRRISDSLKNN